jgi:hypothetical protein
VAIVVAGEEGHTPFVRNWFDDHPNVGSESLSNLGAELHWGWVANPS